MNISLQANANTLSLLKQEAMLDSAFNRAVLDLSDVEICSETPSDFSLALMKFTKLFPLFQHQPGGTPENYKPLLENGLLVPEEVDLVESWKVLEKLHKEGILKV